MASSEMTSRSSTESEEMKHSNRTSFMVSWSTGLWHQQLCFPAKARATKTKEDRKRNLAPKNGSKCSERSWKSRDNLGHLLTWTDVLLSIYIYIITGKIHCVTSALARTRLEFTVRQSTSPMLSIAQHCSAASAFLGILGVRRILSDDQLEHRPDIWDRYRWHFMVLHGTSMHSDTFPADRLTELAESCCTSIWCTAGKVLLTMPVVHNEHAVDTCLLVLPVSESCSTSLNYFKLKHVASRERERSCFFLQSPKLLDVTIAVKFRRLCESVVGENPSAKANNGWPHLIHDFGKKNASVITNSHDLTRFWSLSFRHQRRNCLSATMSPV
jgi:hypothetical protein